MSSRTVAAVDCGTNSVRLLISRDGSDVLRRMEIVRLGAGVDRTGRLDPAALDRTRAALESYAADIARHRVTGVRMVATSAIRDAANRDRFVAMARAVLGIEPSVLTGAEEAALSYAGATAGLPPGTRWPVLAVDIGGGSTEVVWGEEPGRPRGSSSVDIGCVRLTERCLHGDPPTPEEIDAAARVVHAALADAFARADLAGHDGTGGAGAAARPIGTLVGLAGSVTTVAAHVLGLPRYDPQRLHGARLSAPDALAACRDLLGMPRAQRARLPFMHPGRVDVIGGGALVLSAVLQRTGVAGLTVSEHDILDGIAAGLAAAPDAPRDGGVAESPPTAS